jgi:hypothetical protein
MPRIVGRERGEDTLALLPVGRVTCGGAGVRRVEPEKVETAVEEESPRR